MANIPPFDLVIFDCDGTLVDTEYLHNKVAADELALLGLPQYTVEHNLVHFAGKGMETVVATIEAETGNSLPAEFVDRYIEAAIHRMPELLRSIEGVREVIEHCRDAGIKICVGSNGERRNVIRSLEIAEFIHLFPPSAVFTKDMVRHGKPAPDLFLLAAARMGVSPDRTLVVEDSVTGATAGVAAGMTVIGFTGTFHDPAPQEKALRDVGVHYVAHQFREIIPYLERAAARQAPV